MGKGEKRQPAEDGLHGVLPHCCLDCLCGTSPSAWSIWHCGRLREDASAWWPDARTCVPWGKARNVSQRKMDYTASSPLLPGLPLWNEFLCVVKMALRAPAGGRECLVARRSDLCPMGKGEKRQPAEDGLHGVLPLAAWTASVERVPLRGQDGTAGACGRTRVPGGPTLRPVSHP
ncbi:uncharacterized protein LOC144145059 [Haemaphysalis longicornis]